MENYEEGKYRALKTFNSNLLRHARAKRIIFEVTNHSLS